MKSKKCTKVSIELKEPLSIIVNYHHYKDLTILQVVKTYADGKILCDVARSSSCVYHTLERRAFFTDVNRVIKHIIHNSNYND